jgi:hypothetical protein
MFEKMLSQSEGETVSLRDGDSWKRVIRTQRDFK